MESPAQPLRAESQRHTLRAAPQPHDSHAWLMYPEDIRCCSRCGAHTGTPHGLQPCPRDPIHGMATALREHPLRIGAAASHRTVAEVLAAQRSPVGCCDLYCNQMRCDCLATAHWADRVRHADGNHQPPADGRGEMEAAAASLVLERQHDAVLDQMAHDLGVHDAPVLVRSSEERPHYGRTKPLEEHYSAFQAQKDAVLVGDLQNLAKRAADDGDSELVEAAVVCWRKLERRIHESGVSFRVHQFGG